LKNDGTPIALPIFFNCYKEEMTLDNAHSAIDSFIESNPKLKPYFYPKYKYTTKIPDKSIFKIPQSSLISKADFHENSNYRMHKKVIENYNKLAREYFLD
jgi:chromosome partitioning protein